MFVLTTTGPDVPLIRRPRVLLLYVAVVLMGILLQTARYCADDVIDRDSVFYIRGVETWYEYGDFSALPKELISPRNTTAMKYYTAPFYLFILKTLKRVFPFASTEKLALVWGIAAGGLSIWLTMLSARIIFRDDAAALFAGFLLALHPRFSDMAPRPLRDMTYLLLVASTVYLMLLALSRRAPLFSFSSGLLCVAGLTCRVEYAALLVALFVIFVLDIATVRKRSLPIWGAFGGGCAASYVFWTLLMGIPWDFLPVYLRSFIAK